MKNTKQKEHKSNSWIFLLLICVTTCCMGIGYAQINSIIFNIDGSVAAEPQDHIYITDVKYVSDNNATLDDTEINSFYQTMLNSTIVLSPTDVDSSITYEITVYNSNDLDFSYIDVIFDDDFYDNTNIVFELTNLNEGDTIDPKGELTFQITFKYKDGVVPSSDINKLNSYLNFRFLHLVNYIESTGVQYIDTGIKPDNNTTFDIKFAFHTIHETQAILGTRTGMDEGNLFNLFLHKRPSIDNGQLRWDEGTMTGEYVSTLPLNEWKIIEIEKTLNTIKYVSNDVTVVQEFENKEFSMDSNIYVFNQNQLSSDETRRAKIKLYGLNLYQDGKIVREYVPVLDRTGLACLFDKVTNEYFYNIGEEKFGYSTHNNIYEYLECTGTQYIDLNVTADQITQVEMVMSLNSAYADTQGIFGARRGYSTDSFNMFWFDNKLRWDYDETFNYPSTTDSITYIILKPTYILANSSTVQINSDISTYTNSTTFDTGNNIYVFAINNGGTVGFLNNGMRLYYLKIRYNGGIVRNLIPVTDPNGEPCLYDLYDQTFFRNLGTGTFNISR